jgi:hypothetical protein
MEETMSNAVLPAAAALATEEIVVSITIIDNVVTIEPDPVHVPYGFDGVISWVIQHPDARFKEPPILFTDPSIAVPPTTQLKTAQVPWVNDNTTSEPKSYPYIANLLDGGKRRKHDPTVENDPPGYIRTAQSRA